eukprot:2441498-Karenia_brevis.AAC.1
MMNRSPPDGETRPRHPKGRAPIPPGPTRPTVRNPKRGKGTKPPKRRGETIRPTGSERDSKRINTGSTK